MIETRVSIGSIPLSVPAVRFALAQHTRERCEQIAAAALSAATARDARAAVLEIADSQVVSALALR
ncbi:hypothetical protein [Microbacterium sp. PMB16]|uniref:hypothetical protein n=1 Tax=Microbacterium sp. PMB16 TaxID=3120157 RepID=UPI003F4BE724